VQAVNDSLRRIGVLMFDSVDDSEFCRHADPSQSLERR
jgi:hypothetical protein